MSIKRRRFDRDSANAAGLDYLLRRAARLDTALFAEGVGDTFEPFSGPIEPTFLVAASNTRPEIRGLADYVCSGSFDEDEIQLALDACGVLGEGRVVLCAGDFYIGATATLAMPHYVDLVGMGFSTVIHADGVQLTVEVGRSGSVRDFKVEGQQPT